MVVVLFGLVRKAKTSNILKIKILVLLMICVLCRPVDAFILANIASCQPSSVLLLRTQFDMLEPVNIAFLLKDANIV